MNAEQEMAQADGLGADEDARDAQIAAGTDPMSEADMRERAAALIGEDRLPVEELERIVSEYGQDVIEGTVPARELEPGWQVKAPGAPGWSRITAIGFVTPGKVVAFTEWGSLIYEDHEQVEALEPVN